MPLYESDIEVLAVDLLSGLPYEYLDPEVQEKERENLSEVILKDRLRAALKKLNPKLPAEALEDAFKQVINLPSQNLLENNEAFHRMLTDGIDVEYQKNGEVKGAKVWLVDFANPHENVLVVANQYTVVEAGNTKRPDVVLIINGLPLVVIELKNATDENATTQKAYQQLVTYKHTIPSLFHYNALVVASDGHDAKAGTITSDWSRFMTWKGPDQKKQKRRPQAEMVMMINEMLAPEVLLDLVKQFIVFEKVKKEDPESGIIQIETIKKIAAYHQYYA